MNKGTILYVGGFILPDKNAAAQRVIGIAKALRDLDYSVTFLNVAPDAKSDKEWEEKKYFGFTCYEIQTDYSQKGTIKKMFDISHIVAFVERMSDVSIIIAYNYPSVALYRLNRYCRKRNIKCIGDVTEWYGTRGYNTIYTIVKKIDTYNRMRVVHKRLSGNIVISDFLENYYKQSMPIINLPPLVDKKEPKWDVPHEKKLDKTYFVYAGSPSSEKERLDLIYEAIVNLSESYNIELSIIGITEDQFRTMYHYSTLPYDKNNSVVFLGRVSHEEVIRRVSTSDYSIIVRDNNLVNTAGFPTKFSESISCKTAVLANRSSCIEKYFHDGHNGLIISIDNLYEDIKSILDSNHEIIVDENTFDYREYKDLLKRFLENIKV